MRQTFDKFLKSDCLSEVVDLFRSMWNSNKQDKIPTNPKEFYDLLKDFAGHTKSSLWEALDENFSLPQYKEQQLKGKHVLIVGAGPAGLVTAIEAVFLGAKPIIIEKRDKFSRHNVLLLWEYSVDYFKRIGVKALYPRLCVGSLYHVSIRRLQLVLTKIALILGVQIYLNTEFEEMKSSPDGWHAIVSTHDKKNSIFTLGHRGVTFDALFGCDGLNSHVANVFNYEMKTIHAKQAIGITWNFVNHRTTAENHAEEITYSRHMLREWFDNLKKEKGIDLENCVYLCDETHYFICTAVKENLISFGVLKNDCSSSAELLADDNRDHSKLVDFAKSIALFAELPEDIEFIKNDLNQPDIQMFDFTQKQCATEQVKLIHENSSKLFVCLVGDALTEPFWPQGTGANRAVLSAQDGLFSFTKFVNPKVSDDDMLDFSAKFYSKLCFCAANSVKRCGNFGDNDFRDCGLNPETRYLC